MSHLDRISQVTQYKFVQWVLLHQHRIDLKHAHGTEKKYRQLQIVLRLVVQLN